ncbi:hypothetical protein (plasmid) [Metabacillus dongyingensis]|nr:hypothetical protein [Metabacillus dongyingensis]
MIGIIVSLNLKNKKNQYVTVNKFRELLEKYKYKVGIKRKTENYIKTTYYIISER